MSSILERLSRVTYVTEHNPNCPSPYLVRMPGWGKGRVEGKSKDAFGYGTTLEAAARAAFAMLEEQKSVVLEKQMPLV